MTFAMISFVDVYSCSFSSSPIMDSPFVMLIVFCSIKWLPSKAYRVECCGEIGMIDSLPQCITWKSFPSACARCV